MPAPGQTPNINTPNLNSIQPQPGKIRQIGSLSPGNGERVVGGGNGSGFGGGGGGGNSTGNSSTGGTSQSNGGENVSQITYNWGNDVVYASGEYISQSGFAVGFVWTEPFPWISEANKPAWHKQVRHKTEDGQLLSPRLSDVKAFDEGAGADATDEEWREFLGYEESQETEEDQTPQEYNDADGDYVGEIVGDDVIRDGIRKSYGDVEYHDNTEHDTGAGVSPTDWDIFFGLKPATNPNGGPGDPNDPGDGEGHPGECDCKCDAGDPHSPLTPLTPGSGNPNGAGGGLSSGAGAAGEGIAAGASQQQDDWDLDWSIAHPPGEIPPGIWKEFRKRAGAQKASLVRFAIANGVKVRYRPGINGIRQNGPNVDFGGVSLTDAVNNLASAVGDNIRDSPEGLTFGPALWDETKNGVYGGIAGATGGAASGGLMGGAVGSIGGPAGIGAGAAAGAASGAIAGGLGGLIYGLSNPDKSTSDIIYKSGGLGFALGFGAGAIGAAYSSAVAIAAGRTLPRVKPPGRTLPNSTKGWKVGDPINNLTRSGKVPSWSAVRQRFWKNEALNNPGKYDAANLARMKRGLAPQRINQRTGKLESKELHHSPPQREGGLFDVKAVWPDEHALIDSCRRTGH